MDKSRPVRVDLLINPFCMAARDAGTVRGLCAKMGADLRVYNLWDIGDDTGDVPEYVGRLVREWCSGKRPGSVYCNVFVAGERLPLDNWPGHMESLKAKIEAAGEEGQP